MQNLFHVCWWWWRGAWSAVVCLCHTISSVSGQTVGCCSRPYITRRLFIKFGVFRVKTTLTMPIITLIKIIYSNNSAAAVIVVAAAVATLSLSSTCGLRVWCVRFAFAPPLTPMEIARRRMVRKGEMQAHTNTTNCIMATYLWLVSAHFYGVFSSFDAFLLHLFVYSIFIFSFFVFVFGLVHPCARYCCCFLYIFLAENSFFFFFMALDHAAKCARNYMATMCAHEPHAPATR